jgi:hypothetical protein
MAAMAHDVEDLGLAEAGRHRVDRAVAVPRFATGPSRRGGRLGADLPVAAGTALLMGILIEEFTPREQGPLATWTRGT